MSASDLTALIWDQPAQGQVDPFLWPLQVQPSHIDHYGHVNNSVYLQWLQDCAWAHLQSLGLQLSDYQRLNRALVVYRHELDYLAPAYQDEQLVMATWLEQHDKLSVYRRFQLQRCHDGKTLFRAYSRYVCTRLSDGKVCRLPELFLNTYAKAGL
ncbi:acyl-CoA thioester hydrolase [Oceanospirillum multiglobuliferum]|uniref:Uncharacterized protein n=1 Tax=Oceanospirillum multiglobuliferum TaxID=64969 RepID=A0A1T4SM70_9GAMM|nr:acyl-CoA thioesterase [Oceanospirillum multiglobuliferum]OPX54174.1 hypothetical protein BTE48_15555 [Oceanospirillum multiglobuliferum]SKA29394.1 acyl-CoA thioester hydrolase [Oceanospirillum multiglobuliferum]